MPAMSPSRRPPRRALIEREYGPFDDRPTHGIAYDGRRLWIAAGKDIQALDPRSGAIVGSLPVASDAGTAYDGRHLYQLTGEKIQRIDTQTGQIVGTIPAPGRGRDSGMTWAEGKLWVGQYRDRKIHCIDPKTGKIIKTIECDRFVTGVTWTGGELWHGTWEDDASELRRVDSDSGEVLERYQAPEGVNITGLSSDGDCFFCGSGPEGRVRALRRPGRS